MRAMSLGCLGRLPFASDLCLVNLAAADEGTSQQWTKAFIVPIQADKSNSFIARLRHLFHQEGGLVSLHSCSLIRLVATALCFGRAPIHDCPLAGVLQKMSQRCSAVISPLIFWDSWHCLWAFTSFRPCTQGLKVFRSGLLLRVFPPYAVNILLPLMWSEKPRAPKNEFHCLFQFANLQKVGQRNLNLFQGNEAANVEVLDCVST
mmetsp:Transcript_85127/g.104381  ORF Transcript_85127/g.104381 Transcript_85127/m.104381 type:complete len:205 (-) Transcript_85127:316-930(-)